MTNCFYSHAAHMLGSVRQQCHMPRLFKSHAKTALVLSAGSRLAAGFDFATIRNVPFHETARILVINLSHMIVTKLAYFTARSALASPARSLATRASFRSSLHEQFSSIYPLKRNLLGVSREGRPGSREEKDRGRPRSLLLSSSLNWWMQP